MGALIWIILVAAIVIVVGAVVSARSRRHRSQELRGRFGPEYDRTVELAGGERAAARELAEREGRHDSLELHALSEDTRIDYIERWREAQAVFADAPVQAIDEADVLIRRVMRDRGYSDGDFDQRVLRYVSDDRPGITRQRSGRGFSYRAPDGAPIRDKKRIESFRALAIPPAWTDVWICPNPNGHLLATGRDARGRKQYRYHPEWREIRDATKFDRMVPFGAALPAVRERVERDLGLRGLPREKVLAAVLHLIDVTLMRVGNDEYARLNASFGASTMRNEHASVRGSQVLMSFRGKHGRDHAVRVADRRLARVVRRCQDLPGEELFGYLDELGAERDVRSEDVNEYVRELAGQDFTVKDFRTWGASVLAAGLLGEIGPGETTTDTTRRQNAAIRIVAHDLGNTPAVCRSSYIHPAVLDAFRDGRLETTRLEAPAAIDGLRETEAYLLDLLGAPAPVS